MNVLLIIIFFVFFGSFVCFAIGKLVEDILRELRPDWFTTRVYLLPVPKTNTQKRVRIIPRRTGVMPVAHSRRHLPKHSSLVTMLLAVGFFAQSHFFTSRNHNSDFAYSAQVIPLMDGIPMGFWPVWARSGNENIFSKVKILGERFVIDQFIPPSALMLLFDGLSLGRLQSRPGYFCPGSVSRSAYYI